MERVGEVIVGIVVMAIACGLGASGGATITVLTMGFLGGVGMFVSIVSLLAVALVLVAVGTGNGKLGYAWAPVVFFGGWALISVAMRANLSFEAENITPPEIAPALAQVRTLVVDAHPSLPRTFVTEGAVERLVEITYQNNDRTKAIKTIRQTMLAEGADCTAEDNAQSSVLHRIGRIDECLKTIDLATLPDGLHILRQPFGRDSRYAQELTAVIVAANQNTPALTWKRAYARVPAYFPFFRMSMGPFDKAPTIWETRAGPFEMVAYGALDLKTEVMAAAIYGFDPTKPPRALSLSNAELSHQAAMLAERGDQGGLADGWALTSRLFDARYIDDNAVKVAIQKVRDPRAFPIDELRLGRFVQAFSPEQRARFNDGAIHVLSTPSICKWCWVDDTTWTDVALAHRAVEAFGSTVGLERWQYIGLVNVAGATAWNGPTATAPGANRQLMLTTAVSSADASASTRLAGFIVATLTEMLQSEAQALTAAVDKLDQSDIYAVATSRYNSPSQLDQIAHRNRSFPREIFVQKPEWLAFWNALLAQVDIIPAGEKREIATRHINEKLAAN
ncbi:hypothetical protein RB623_13520 [Mesorhizobium sp. LHD-90]|uniref:hypothetical protein n=1 Tax=Mesorhizobium sp. LHD-90 TaxID=3071414 RepID=UPI0027DF9D29|nr:hypothetical protein [Mesorhizobium sp. LHD-90]MDQ6435070.1 hypothetical protein [Mesorhizobium sp. LHD-90]